MTTKEQIQKGTELVNIIELFESINLDQYLHIGTVDDKGIFYEGINRLSNNFSEGLRNAMLNTGKEYLNKPLNDAKSKLANLF